MKDEIYQIEDLELLQKFLLKNKSEKLIKELYQ